MITNINRTVGDINEDRRYYSYFPGNIYPAAFPLPVHLRIVRGREEAVRPGQQILPGTAGRLHHGDPVVPGSTVQHCRGGEIPGGGELPLYQQPPVELRSHNPVDRIQALQDLIHLQKGEFPDTHVRQADSPLLLHADRPQESAKGNGNRKPRRPAADRNRELRRSVPRGQAQQGMPPASIPQRSSEGRPEGRQTDSRIHHRGHGKHIQKHQTVQKNRGHNKNTGNH